MFVLEWIEVEFGDVEGNEVDYFFMFLEFIVDFMLVNFDNDDEFRIEDLFMDVKFYEVSLWGF